MRHPFDRRWRRLTALVVALLATAGGVAYATIPGSGNTYTACMLKNIGTVRLIDPTLPSSNLMSHCTALEAQISWNQQGQKGDPGPPGVPGKNGADGANGISPTVTQLVVGDSNCPNGGAAITDAAGRTAYVCSGANGQDGKDGQPFAGNFTSPDGLFSLTVADSGIQLKGPDSAISLPQAPLLGLRITSTGEVLIQANDLNTAAAHDESISVAHDLVQTVDHDATTHVGHDRTETVDNNQTLTIHGDRTETVDNNQALTIHGDRTEIVDGNQGVTVHGNRTETVGTNESIMIGGNRTESVGGSDGLSVAGNRSENVSGAYDVQAGGAVNLRGSLVRINGGTNCQQVARVGDLVSPSGDVILTGSATVCVGGP